ncbi:MAG: hypothetical protein AAF266_13475, partial [Planctomycetota bacterium]
MNGHLLRRLTAATILLTTPLATAVELPWWVDSVTVTPPVPQGGLSYGAVTLSGTWIDSGAPDAIGHTFRDGALHLSVSAPNLGVPTLDVLTPWTLTEEFAYTDFSVNEIFGSIFSVDPRQRGYRVPVSTDDFLGYLFPPPRGSFEGLGTGEDDVSAAYDVSADGRVVSGANQLAPRANGLITEEAFVWTPETGRTTIGLLPGGVPGGSRALGVSADGNYLAGVSSSGSDVGVDREAFRWSLGAGMEGLGTINGPSSTSEARAISAGGRVVVGVDTFSPPVIVPASESAIAIPFFNGKRAFRYTDEGGMQDLGPLPEYAIANGSWTEAVDVSSDGATIVGNANRGPLAAPRPFGFPGPTDIGQPFVWTEDGGMVGLGNLPRFVPADAAFRQQETVANAISADGSAVVGYDVLSPPPPGGDFLFAARQSAVRWTEGEGWIDLGQLRLGRVFSLQTGASATDVSGDGEIIIGSATITTPCLTDVFPCNAMTEEIPFLWDEARGMRPLERVLAGDFGLDFDGWELGEATAISDDGTTIVGTGTNPDGVQEAWRAVLHRNTPMGDADFDGDVDTDDYATIIANLGRLRTPLADIYYEDGDFNADGAITWDDLDLLRANYDGRSAGDFNADGVVNAADY